MAAPAAIAAPSATEDPALERAIDLHRGGQFSDAAAAYDRVPGDHPHRSSICFLHAGAALRADGLGHARELVTRGATAGDLPLPDNAEAYAALGEKLRMSGGAPEAVPCYEIALQLDPALVEAYVGLGLVYGAFGRPLEAAACFQSALRFDAECIPALLNLGTAWRQVGQRESALPCYRFAVELAPQRVEALFLLGTLLCELRELEEAIAVHRRALALAPDHAGVLSDLGSALVLRGELAEGLVLLQRAVELAPQWPAAHVNLGIALARERRMTDALDCFRAALDADPKFVYARFCESNVYLTEGDLARGYAMYDAHRAVYPHRYRDRQWDGGPLEGRTILLYAQHGLGDTLQFVRYVPRVAALGGRVILQVQGELVPLLRHQPGADAVLALHENPGPFDVQATLLELPAIFGDSVDTLPVRVPYLAADPALIAAWRTRLTSDSRFKIGIAWHGNPNQKDGLIRRCALRDMTPVWNVPGVAVYSLQAGAGAEELTSGGPVPVQYFDGLDMQHGAFMDTAAIMENLDLMITIDTSIVHLAGGLGRPVWLALPYWPDWRWMLDRSDSPWYPTMRVFRQPRLGDWQPVFAEVAAALQEHLRPRDRSGALLSAQPACR